MKKKLKVKAWAIVANMTIPHFIKEGTVISISHDEPLVTALSLFRVVEGEFIYTDDIRRKR